MFYHTVSSALRSTMSMMKVLSLSRLLMYMFLFPRIPRLPIPDCLSEGVGTLLALTSTDYFLIFFIFGLCTITLINLGTHFCSHCYFVPFDVSLNMLRKRAKSSFLSLNYHLMRNIQIFFFFTLYLNDGCVVHIFDKFLVLDSLCFKTILATFKINNFFFNLGLDLSQKLIFCNYSKILHPWCHTYEFKALWLFALILLLSSDVHPNPGPHITQEFSNGFLSFCNWNLNTLSKDNFCRVSLLEAHNTIFKYDIISLCETSLNDEVQVREGLLPGYQYHPLNHPDGSRNGGVGIFYKESLPLKIRSDLSFDECLVSELNFGRKKIFFTVFYRNPEHKAGSEGFEDFLTF